MKKKLVGITTLAAVLTLAAGMTAFAGWEPDPFVEGETVWRNDKGSIVYAGWVTDPDTGYQYYMDPDGHKMTGTTVEGYWLDDDGVKHEKSEAELAAEERRAAKEAAYITPGKVQSATNAIANEARSAMSAASTTRRNFQAEMYSISDKAFTNIKNGLADAKVTNYKGDVSKTNLSDKFYYNSPEGVEIISSDMPKAAEGTSAYYEYALEIHYNRNLVHDELATLFNQAFEDLVNAALGEEAGAAVNAQIAATVIGSDDSYSFDGLTATGNSYNVRYSSNNAYVRVTCSEIVIEPVEEAVEGEEALLEGEAAEIALESEEIAEEVIEEAEATQNVIMAGSAQAQAEEEVAEEVAYDLSEEVAEEIYDEALDLMEGEDAYEYEDEEYEEDLDDGDWEEVDLPV